MQAGLAIVLFGKARRGIAARRVVFGWTEILASVWRPLVAGTPAASMSSAVVGRIV